MAFTGRAVSVSTTPKLLVQGFDHSGTSNATAALVKNTDATLTVYLGGSDVTTAAGYPLAAGEAIPVGDVGDSDDLYGITASGTAVVRVLEVQ